jgi:hypothetical protein
MESNLIRLLPSLPQRSFAWLTLCAMLVPASPAIAQSAPASDAFTQLLRASSDSDAIAVPKFTWQGVTTPIEPTLAEASPSEPPPATDEGSDLRTAGYVASGVGLVGLALFAIAGLGAKSAYDKLDTDCGSSPCTDEAHRSDIEGGRMLQTAANIGLAAGLTGLGVGATLLVLGNRSTEKREPSASVSVSGTTITLGGHF